MNIKSYAVMVLAAMAASMTSCNDEYWDQDYPDGATYAFPKPVYTVNVAEGTEIPASYEIIMTRNNSGAEVSVPVEAKFSDPALSGAQSVTFAAGSNTAVYTINVDPAIPGGASFSVSLKLADDLYSKVDTLHNKCKFTLNTPYAWESAGKAAVMSAWAGNEAPVDVPVQRATNYAGTGVLYRLVSLYYYLEPDYADEGYGIQFLLDSDGAPMRYFPNIQEMGEGDNTNGDYALGCWADGAYGTSFTREGDTYTIVALLCTNKNTPSWYPTSSMEELSFTWTASAK